MQAAEAGAASGAPSTRRYLRGSSLLLAGRFISIFVNFLVQVLAVRYLAKSDYGAFAWALAVVSMGSSVARLGLNRGVARFVPIHHEHGAYGAMFGTMALALGTVTGLGLSLVALVLGARGFLADHVASDPLSVGLLLILIGLAPVQALDNILQVLLAAFADARSIFLRRYVLGPGLKLVAVCLVIAVGGSVRLLAIGYLVAGIIGIAIYVLLLWRVLRREGLLGKLRAQRLTMPARRLFSFCVPLLSTDVLMVFETTIVVMLLEYFRGTTEVAELRAVVPVAGLVLVVFESLKLLFAPQAARHYARGEESGLNDLYWRSAAWLTIASFPIFAVCLFLAEPVTVLLFGERYAGAAVLLAILAAGKYFNAALGLNTYALQVHARVRAITIANVLSAGVGLLLSLWLIPRHGAIGAAGATAATLITRNGLYQGALMVTTSIGAIPAKYVKVYGGVLAAVAALAVLRLSGASHAAVAAGVAAAAAILAWTNHAVLEIGDTFPELARVPVLGRLLGAGAG